MRIPLFTLLILFFLAASAFADSPQEVMEDIKEDARDTINRVYQNLDQGRAISSNYTPEGSQWLGDRYKDHPWADGNPNWKQVWENDDHSIIMKGFDEYYTPCFDFRIIGCCCLTCPCRIRWVGYWWPEVVVSVNNYCISSLMGPDGTKFRDIRGAINRCAVWKQDLHSVLKGDVEADVIRRGISKLNVPGATPIDASLLPEPQGQTHVDSRGVQGQRTRHYEAHIFRTYADVLASEDKLDLPAVEDYWDPPCFMPDCVNPQDETELNPKLYTESTRDGRASYWRIPGRSMERVTQGASGSYRELWEGAAKSAFNLDGSVNALNQNTCASHRSHPAAASPALMGWKNPIDKKLPNVRLGINSRTDAALRRNCLPQELGQVYPLTGGYYSNAERIDVILAALRAIEWSAWKHWPDLIRINHFSFWGDFMSDWHPSTVGMDAGVMNVVRTTGHWAIGPRNIYVTNSWWARHPPPDKLQRVYPIEEGKTDRCFTIHSLDRRHGNPELFPKGLYLDNREGETRLVFWNYRTCCIDPVPPPQGYGCVPVYE